MVGLLGHYLVHLPVLHTSRGARCGWMAPTRMTMATAALNCGMLAGGRVGGGVAAVHGLMLIAMPRMALM